MGHRARGGGTSCTFSSEAENTPSALILLSGNEPMSPFVPYGLLDILRFVVEKGPACPPARLIIPSTDVRTYTPPLLSHCRPNDDAPRFLHFALGDLPKSCTRAKIGTSRVCACACNPV